MCCNNENKKRCPWKIIDDRKPNVGLSLWDRFLNGLGDIDVNNIGDECVIWQIGKETHPKFGFGNKFRKFIQFGPCKEFISIIPRSLIISRLSYEMAYGPIPKNYVIDHKCGNNRCVNPNHLELKPYKKPKEINSPDPDTIGFRNNLNDWVDVNGDKFDRDIAVGFGYNYCCYIFINKENNNSYKGYTNITRKGTRLMDDFLGYASSCKNKNFKKDIRKNPGKYIRKVLSLHTCEEDALKYEEIITMELDEKGIPYWKRKDSYNGIKGGIKGFATGKDNPMYGRKHTPEAKKAISEANKGNKNGLGYKKTDEQKRKDGENSKKRWEKEEFRKMMLSINGRSVIFKFKEKIFGFENINDFCDFFKISQACLFEWTKNKKGGYKKLGFEWVKTVKKSTKFLNLDDYPEIKTELLERAKDLGKGIKIKVIFNDDRGVMEFKSRRELGRYLGKFHKNEPVHHTTIKNWIDGKYEPEKKYNIISIRNISSYIE